MGVNVETPPEVGPRLKWRVIAYRREQGLVLGGNGEWKTSFEEKERREGIIEEFVSGDQEEVYRVYRVAKWRARRRRVGTWD